MISTTELYKERGAGREDGKERKNRKQKKVTDPPCSVISIDDAHCVERYHTAVHMCRERYYPSTVTKRRRTKTVREELEKGGKRRKYWQREENEMENRWIEEEKKRRR